MYYLSFSGGGGGGGGGGYDGRGGERNRSLSRYFGPPSCSFTFDHNHFNQQVVEEGDMAEGDNTVVAVVMVVR